MVAILVLSVALRLGVALYLGNGVDSPTMLTDQRSYYALGMRLLEGKGYSFGEHWYPFTRAGEPTAHWSFLYPLFVAAIYRIAGPNPLAVRLVQGVLGGLLLPWVVHGLAKRCFPTRPRVWLWSALMAACYLYFVLYATTVMTETPYIIMLVLAMDLTIRAQTEITEGRLPERRTMMGLGLVLGVTALIRQSILPWLPVLFIWLLCKAKPGARVALFWRLFGAGLAVLLLIAPWTWRNYRVYGQFLLLNSNTGYTMYSAQHPMHGTVFSEFEAAPLPTDIVWANEAAMDKMLMRKGLAFVVEDPVRYVRLCLSRARAFLEFWPSRDTSVLHNIGRVGSFGLYLPFYLSGWVLVLRDRDLRGRLSLLGGFGLFYAALHIVTWAMVRYRLPIDAVLLPIAALAADAAAQALWRRGFACRVKWMQRG